MSDNRQEPLPKKSKTVKRTKDSDVMATISGSLEEMAKVHCEHRNDKVARILGFCTLIRHRHPVGLTGSYAGAVWQINRDTIETAYKVPPEWEQRIETAKLTQEERAKIEAKFTSRQDAHHAPCRLRLNGRSLDSYFSDPALRHTSGEDTLRVIAIQALFGAVDPLPSIFNECDSQAEHAHLKKALVAACMTINPNSPVLNQKILTEAQTEAFDVWLSKADLAFAQTLDSNQKLRDKSPEGSCERLYRDAKITILEYYRRFTASEIPLMGGGAAASFLDD